MHRRPESDPVLGNYREDDKIIMPWKKPKIGDIIEIKTTSGLAYIQYTHDTEALGELVRILPGLFSARPLDFAALARQKELYFVFYTLMHALRRNLVEIVAHQPVPDWAQPFPLMRWGGFGFKDGKTTPWKIFKASDPLTIEMHQRTSFIQTLTPEQEKLSIHHLWPPPVMEKELARGWTPERAEEIRLKDVIAAAQREQNQATKNESLGGMRHFLYFSRKADAARVGKQLCSRGFTIELRKSAEGDKWLVLATQIALATGLEMEELCNELKALADKFGGEYDYFEVPI